VRNVEKRLRIPITGNPETEFRTKSGLLVAKGYIRVVIGGRGPYIEFSESMIYKDSFFVPEEERWRHTNKVAYYDEYRSKDTSYVKLYHQKRTVAYADYKIGLYYISPSDLYTNMELCINTERKLGRSKFFQTKNGV
jgi:hypothetical protein